MTEETITPEVPGLGELLELLHRADAPFESVQVTYRIWRHAERADAAFHARIEEEKRRGAAVGSIQLAGGASAPSEHEEQLRLWRAGEHVREEREGGPRDGFYGVRAGELWWRWDQLSGAISNEDDPKVGGGVGHELSVMLDPTPLLGSLRFRALGFAHQAGRATITAEAVPRPSGRDGPRSFQLHELGSGADRYTLEVDAERGVLLGVVALRDGEPFYRVTTVEIAFDEPIADERFEFQPPAGEEIRTVGIRPPPRHLPLTEAQRRAPFTVFMPGQVPADWQLHCMFIEPTERPPAPAQVALQYRSESGHENVHLSQFSAADRPSQYDLMTRAGGWDEVTDRGTVIRVRKPTTIGPGQAQAQLERDGTFIFLMSETLSAEELTRIAVGLTAAPSESGV